MIIEGTTFGVIKGDTRSLDSHSSGFGIAVFWWILMGSDGWILQFGRGGA